MSTTITPTEQNIEINVNNDVIDINVTNEIVDVNATTQQIDINVAGAYPIPNPVLSVFGRTGVVVATEGDYTLTQLGDVTLTSPTNGQVLKYNGTTWVNGTDAGGLTSVGLSMPTAFTVTNSPLTSNGTIAVTGAGTTAQYVRGDGTLATFPSIITQAQNLVTEVYNRTGATLTKGTIVYINGGQGNLPTVTKALATGDSTSAQTYGVVQTDITNMNNGYVVVAGRLSDLDTQAYTEGTQLYLSSTTAGTWTSTKQYAPAHLVYVGIVVRAHPTQGIVEIKIQNGYELDEIHNVAAQTPTNNDGLFWESATSLWKNKSISAILGGTPVTGTGTTNYLAKFTGSSTIGIGQVLDDGTSVLIGTTSSTPNVKVGIYSTTQRALEVISTNSNALFVQSPAAYIATISNGTWYTNFTNTGRLDLAGDLLVNTIANATTDTDRFLVSDSGVIKYRTGAELLSDIGGQGIITNPITGTGTSGQVAYFNGTNSITSESNLFWDATNDRLGIGTATPSSPLDIIGSATSGFDAIKFRGQYTQIGYLATSNSAVYLATGAGVTGSYLELTSASANLRAGTTNITFTIASERARINNNGNFLINQTTDAGFRLDVNGTARVQGNTTVTGNLNVITGSGTSQVSIGDGSTSNNGTLRISKNATSNAANIFFRSSSTDVGRIWLDNSDNLTLTNGSSITIASTGLSSSGSITAASAIARGVNFNNTLVAAANNDVLVALDINPTFTAGAFTGTSRYVLRTNAPYVSLQNPQVRFSSATTASAFELVRFSGATESHKFQFITGYNGPQLELFAQSTSGGSYDVNVMSFFRNGNVVINSTADSGFKLDLNGTFRQTGSTTAASAIARGSFISPTLVAAANNDVLVGLDINPTFTNGAFTGVSNYALRSVASNIAVTHSGANNKGFYIIDNTNNSTIRAGIIFDGTNAFTDILGRYNNGPAFLRQDGGNGNILFLRNSVEYQRIFGATGNVLIQNGGTFTDAGFRLDVNGTARVQSTLTVGTTAIISTEQAIISGNTSQLLRLFNTGTTPGTQAALTFTTNSSNTSSAISAILLSTGNQTLSFLTPNAGSVVEKLRIWDTGNVLIQNGGTFTDSGFRLDVNGTTRLQSTLTVGGTALISTEQAIISNNAAQQLRLYNSATTAGTQSQLTFTTNTNGAVSSGISAISLDNSGNQTISILTSNAGTAGERLRVWNTGNVHIQNGGTYTDVASSILTMNSTTKGFLPPRMTTTQKNAIATPATGLVVYDTTLNKLSVYTGAAWETVTSL